MKGDSKKYAILFRKKTLWKWSHYFKYCLFLDKKKSIKYTNLEKKNPKAKQIISSPSNSMHIKIPLGFWPTFQFLAIYQDPFFLVFNFFAIFSKRQLTATDVESMTDNDGWRTKPSFFRSCKFLFGQKPI